MLKLMPAIKGGRCYNGNHKDIGKIIHYVPAMEIESYGDWFNTSLCGINPGKRSFGWIETDKTVNCPKCLKKYIKII